jgi:hypothetical protein
MKPVKILLLGAGNRAGLVYAEYAKMNPTMMNIAAVAEPDEVKRKRIQADHHIPDSLAFTTWKGAETLPRRLSTHDKLSLSCVQNLFYRSYRVAHRSVHGRPGKSPGNGALRKMCFPVR